MTYKVLPDEGEASAPQRLGRWEDSRLESGDAAAATGPEYKGKSLAAQFWLMLSFQIISYFSFMTQRLAKPRFVLRYGQDAGPLVTVRMNRSIRRKIARMQRRGRLGGPQLCEANSCETDELAALSPTQLLEWIIRTHKLSRVRVYGLGFKRADLRRVSHTSLDLRGGVEAFAQGLICHDPMSPD